MVRVSNNKAFITGDYCTNRSYSNSQHKWICWGQYTSVILKYYLYAGTIHSAFKMKVNEDNKIKFDTPLRCYCTARHQRINNKKFVKSVKFHRRVKSCSLRVVLEKLRTCRECPLEHFVKLSQHRLPRQTMTSTAQGRNNRKVFEAGTGFMLSPGSREEDK